MTTVSVQVRAEDLATGFSARLVAAVAQALESEPPAILAALDGQGDLQLRLDLADLAGRCFPDLADPVRKLRDLCRAEASGVPTWRALAQIERGVGVKASELFG